MSTSQPTTEHYLDDQTTTRSLQHRQRRPTFSKSSVLRRSRFRKERPSAKDRHLENQGWKLHPLQLAQPGSCRSRRALGTLFCGVKSTARTTLQRAGQYTPTFCLQTATTRVCRCTHLAFAAFALRVVARPGESACWKQVRFSVFRGRKRAFAPARFPLPIPSKHLLFLRSHPSKVESATRNASRTGCLHSRPVHRHHHHPPSSGIRSSSPPRPRRLVHHHAAQTVSLTCDSVAVSLSQ